MVEDIEFSGGTSNNNRQEYRERIKYIKYLRSLNLNLLDTLYEDKLYGLVNKDFEVIVPIASVKLFGNYASTVQGLNYVVSLYTKFRDYFMEVDSLSGSVSVPEMLSGLTPNKSYVNFEEEYENYRSLAATEMLNIMGSKGLRVPLGFPAFVEEVNKILFDREFSHYKLSKSGYALSSFSSIYQTGLYVDMSPTSNPELDSYKLSYVEDPNFECYVNFANEHGFYVDINCPWRMVLNLDSKVTQENILNGRKVEKFANFYSDTYVMKVGYDDFWALKSFYELSYIQLLKDRGIRLPRGNPFAGVDIEHWLRVLILNRFREMDIITEYEQSSELFDQTLQRALDINRSYELQSISGALGYVNTVCAQQLKRIVNESAPDS
jgi:hypothetical protein